MTDKQNKCLSGLEVEVERLRSQLKAAETIIQKVKDLHMPVMWRGKLLCGECSEWDGDNPNDRPVFYEHCSTTKVVMFGENW